ncbi:hypothetical protein [Faecalibacter sp. LW9]|uniref:hypothetical protein n=1 Tax=Faecalibacter sp. LW9 TaxID=3103144 RepID=UPI002AFF600C|nr:hypothetical protein [Faecalibacter sp. LW9]
MGVFRFSNAVSDIAKFINTYKTLYSELNDEPFLGHDEARDALIRHSLVSSSGAIGNEAVNRSVRQDRSRDPLYNQLKMYSEIFRMLGWYQPANNRTSFNFTPISEYIVENGKNIADNIYKFNFYSIVSPNNLVNNVFNTTNRPIKSLLNLAKYADKLISRDEIILDVLTIENDLLIDFKILAEVTKERRFDGNKIKHDINLLVSNEKISETTLQNYTRFPIAGCKYVKWFNETSIKSSTTKSNLKYFQITDEALNYHNQFATKYDLRYSEIENFDKDIKSAFIYLMFLKNLEFIGFEIDDEETNSLINKLEASSKPIFDKINVNGSNDVFYSSVQQSKKEDFENIQNLSL